MRRPVVGDKVWFQRTRRELALFSSAGSSASLFHDSAPRSSFVAPPRDRLSGWMTSPSEVPPGELTRYLRRWREGEVEAFDLLLPHVYDHLRSLARGRLRGERDGHTLDTTALVHEAYLKLVDGAVVDWQDRGHFFAVASRAMRRILVDRAKERGAKKRGGGWVAVELDQAQLGGALAVHDAEPNMMLALDEALERLESEHPRQARAIELRYFGGLTLTEVGECQGTSAPTAMRDLQFAQAWLARELTRQ